METDISYLLLLWLKYWRTPLLNRKNWETRKCFRGRARVIAEAAAAAGERRVPRQSAPSLRRRTTCHVALLPPRTRERDRNIKT